MMKVLTASCAASLANTPANSQLMAVIKKNKINKTHSKLQILTKFETTKSIFHSLLIGLGLGSNISRLAFGENC